MAERVLPPPDLFATCPLDGRVLEYYAETFEAVYVSLHPFIKAVSIDKEQFKPYTYPSRSTIVKTCAPVSWVEMATVANLPSLAAVDVGLRSMIGGLNEVFANRSFADRIEAVYVRENIVPPDEGRFSDLLHDRVL